MLMLTISTSGPVASAAVISNGALLCAMSANRGRAHSETILPLCEELLGANGFAIADMDGFAADIGPGSFTGVRIGVCAVNAMAAAHGRPLAGASSLEGLLHGRENACALLDCRNGNGYAMVRSPLLTLPESPVVIDELLKLLPPDITIVGDAAALHRERILAALPDAVLLPSDVEAGSIGLAAYGRLASGAQLSPLYLRPAQAERLKKGGGA